MGCRVLEVYLGMWVLKISLGRSLIKMNPYHHVASRRSGFYTGCGLRCSFLNENSYFLIADLILRTYTCFFMFFYLLSSFCNCDRPFLSLSWNVGPTYVFHARFLTVHLYNYNTCKASKFVSKSNQDDTYFLTIYI